VVARSKSSPLPVSGRGFQVCKNGKKNKVCKNAVFKKKVLQNKKGSQKRSLRQFLAITEQFPQPPLSWGHRFTIQFYEFYFHNSFMSFILWRRHKWRKVAISMFFVSRSRIASNRKAIVSAENILVICTSVCALRARKV